MRLLLINIAGWLHHIGIESCSVAFNKAIRLYIHLFIREGGGKKSQTVVVVVVFHLNKLH